MLLGWTAVLGLKETRQNEEGFSLPQERLAGHSCILKSPAHWSYESYKGNLGTNGQW